MTLLNVEVKRGDVVLDGRGARFEFVRHGCATGLATCDRRHPVTVARIRRDRTVAPASMTECYEAGDLTPEVTAEQVAGIVNGPGKDEDHD